jgi:hypothetical protein
MRTGPRQKLHARPESPAPVCSPHVVRKQLRQRHVAISGQLSPSERLTEHPECVKSNQASNMTWLFYP